MTSASVAKRNRKKFALFYFFVIVYLSGCAERETISLPLIDNPDQIFITSRYIKDEVRVACSGRVLPFGIEIKDRRSHEAILDFMNSYDNDGWQRPWLGKVIAPVRITFYSQDELLGSFGFGEDYIANHRSVDFLQKIDKKLLQEFYQQLHPVVAESIYEKVPENYDVKAALNLNKKRFNSISIGSDLSEVLYFIEHNNFQITYQGSTRINVNLEVVNNGQYVDTVIRGQYVINDKKKLIKRRYFGMELNSKPEEFASPVPAIQREVCE